MKLDAVVLTLIEVSEPDGSGNRKYVFRVSIPADEFLYSVSAQSEAEAVSRVRRDLLMNMRSRPITSRSEPLALSRQDALESEEPDVPGKTIAKIVVLTLVGRWALEKALGWINDRRARE